MNVVVCFPCLSIDRYLSPEADGAEACDRQMRCFYVLFVPHVTFCPQSASYSVPRDILSSASTLHRIRKIRRTEPRHIVQQHHNMPSHSTAVSMRETQPREPAPRTHRIVVRVRLCVRMYFTLCQALSHTHTHQASYGNTPIHVPQRGIPFVHD